MKTISIKEQKTGELVSQKTIKSIVKAIAQNFHPEKIILFGSYALNREEPDSDVDLLVIMESDLSHYKRSVALQMLFRPIPCAVDILVYTPKEVNKWNGTPNHIITEALLHGIVLYEQES
ncbi:MAG: nucleotidyltransferase domain-containing protein [Chitinispirillia bacterium]|jgi:predicted nucleotidyltransferase